MTSPALSAAHAGSASGSPAAARRRVLHVINGDDYSGAERVQDLLGLRLPDCGYDVVFACLKPGLFETMRKSQQVPLFNTPMRGRFDLRPGRALARLAQEQGCDLIHTHSVRTALVGRVAAALSRRPLIHHMHCQTAVEVGQRLLTFINAWTERISLWGAAGIVAVSRTLEDYLLRHGVKQDRITLVPNGVPGLDTLPAREPPRGEWVLGTVAMFRPRKGVEVLIDALERLRAAGLSARLRCVGRFQTAEYESQIKADVERRGLSAFIDWTGFTRDVPGELARLDLFVLPSVVAEGMPMAVLEAMAAGVPVIGSRVPGVTDVIRHGVDGLLVPPSDPNALAETVARLIHGETDWQALRQAAFQEHHDRFSDHSMARGVAALYDRVLAGVRRR